MVSWSVLSEMDGKYQYKILKVEIHVENWHETAMSALNKLGEQGYRVMNCWPGQDFLGQRVVIYHLEKVQWEKEKEPWEQ